MERNKNIPLNEALDQIAQDEGFTKWSLLSGSMSSVAASEPILSRLEDGDLLQLAGRPGHGKTNLAFNFCSMLFATIVRP